MSILFTIIGICVALPFIWQAFVHMYEHQKFMRELENKQKLRREKAEKLKGLKL